MKNVVKPSPGPASPELEFNFPSLPPSPPPDNEDPMLVGHQSLPADAATLPSSQALKMDRLDSVNETLSNQANKQTCFAHRSAS